MNFFFKSHRENLVGDSNPHVFWLGIEHYKTRLFW